MKLLADGEGVLGHSMGNKENETYIQNYSDDYDEMTT